MTLVKKYNNGKTTTTGQRGLRGSTSNSRTSIHVLEGPCNSPGL